MPRSKGPKFYAVARGKAPGIYTTWPECQFQITGFKGAIFKSFRTREEAQQFNDANSACSTASAAAALTSFSNGVQDRKRSLESGDDNTLSNQRLKTESLGRENCRLQITIHFDGGSRGNPGVAGAGARVVIVDNSNFKEGDNASTTTTEYSIREFCGDGATNNYAEYQGLLVGLKRAKLCIETMFQTSMKPKNPKKKQSQSEGGQQSPPLFLLQIYGDSNLVIQQLKGAWQCRNTNILPLYGQCKRMIASMKVMCKKSKVLFEHIYRDQNKVADALANEAMDQRTSFFTSTTSTSKDSIGNGNDDKFAKSKAEAVPVSKVKKSSSKEKEAVDLADNDDDDDDDDDDSGDDDSNHEC